MSDLPDRLVTSWKDPRLGKLDVVVLGFLHRYLTSDEFRRVKVAVIAHEIYVDPTVSLTALQWQKQATAKSVRRLVSLGYVDRGPYEDGLQTYRLATPPMRVVTRDTRRTA